MKKVIICVFVCLFSLTVFGQKVYMSKQKLDKMICKKWDVEFAALGGMKMRDLNEAANFGLLIKDNGTYDLIKSTGENKEGHWVYNVNKKFVLLFIENEIYACIKSITNTKMILNLEEEENSALSNLDIHLKPI